MKAQLFLLPTLLTLTALIASGGQVSARGNWKFWQRLSWFGIPTQYAVNSRGMKPWRAGENHAVIFCWNYFPKVKENHLKNMKLILRRDFDTDIDLKADIQLFKPDSDAVRINPLMNKNGNDNIDNIPEHEGSEKFFDEPSGEATEKSSNGQSGEATVIEMSTNKKTVLRENAAEDKCFVAKFKIPSYVKADDDYELDLGITKLRGFWTSKYTESKDLIIEAAVNPNFHEFPLTWKNTVRHPFTSFKEYRRRRQVDKHSNPGIQENKFEKCINGACNLAGKIDNELRPGYDYAKTGFRNLRDTTGAKFGEFKQRTGEKTSRWWDTIKPRKEQDKTSAFGSTWKSSRSHEQPAV